MARTSSRAGLLVELGVLIVAGWGLYGVLTALDGNSGLFSSATLIERAPDDLLYRALWYLANMTDAQFYGSVLGGVGLLLGGAIAWRLDVAGSRRRGFRIAAGTGLWPWLIAASALGLAISVALYGSILSEGAWIPTFVPFVSIPAGVVLVYGGGARNVLSGAILGGLIGFPIAYAVIEWVLVPLEFPAVIGNVTGMWLGGAIVFELCHRVLPWMRSAGTASPADDDGADHGDESAAEDDAMDRPGWLTRRTLADFTEAPFFGNEIASLAMLAGVIASWLLDSREPAYGSGLLPAILVSQIMASALGIVIFHQKWRQLGWYPTFVPMVSVAPAVVLTYGGGVEQIVAGSVLGALIGPPLAQLCIGRIPGHWHPYIANTFAMAVSTAVVVAILIPLPGFTLAG